VRRVTVQPEVAAINVGRRIDAVLDEHAAPLVAAYYDRSGPFAGADFDALAPNPAADIVQADLLAVSLLDIRLRPRALRSLLFEDHDDFVSGLRRVPVGVDLWAASVEDLDSAASLLRRLRELDGVDWVTAHKFVARKRPRLVPVLDSVVVRALSLPRGEQWRTLALALGDPGRRERIAAVAPAELDPSVLRLLDVATWMRHSESTNARAARHLLGLPNSAPRPRRPASGSRPLP